jgi:hypothetical protein
MLEVKVDFPHLPKGTEMDVGGLLVKNGETTKVDEDAELSFVSRNQVAMKDKLESDNITVSGSPKYGPAAVEKMFPPVEPFVEESPYADESANKADSSNDGGEN